MSFLVNKYAFSNPRWAIFSRILAAIFGGYAVAISSSLFIGQSLLHFAGQYQAVHIGLMFTFLIYAFIAMWVFSVSTARRAWLGLFKLNVLLLAGAWLLIQVNS